MPKAMVSAAVPVGSCESHQYTGTSRNRKTAMIRNIRAVSFMPSLALLRGALARQRLLRAVPALAQLDLAQRDLGVVQVEGGGLGADPRQRVEVVPRRRAGGRPLQRAAPAPRVVHRHALAGLRRLVD